ncbi:MAG: DUF1727 domain-containing protein, partial [Chloroflexi bacterium]|nr:DUF1727 domain-containing protein [Chloroflexota bacterium]
QTLSLAVPLSGLYNVYNVLAAITAARALGADVPAIGRGVEGFAAAFGRLERIVVRERTVVLALVKNPVGFNQVLRTLFASPGASPGTDGGEKRPPALILINDNFADGTDISWLWDVDFEWLRGRVRGVICGGTRGEDLRVRLKYAGLPVEQLRHVGDPAAAIDAAIAAAEPGETLYILPSYTAMLAVRQVLAQRGLVRGFWEN